MNRIKSENCLDQNTKSCHNVRRLDVSMRGEMRGFKADYGNKARFSNIYVRSRTGAIYSKMVNFEYLIVTGANGVSYGDIKNGFYVGCLASWGCLNSSISNVEYIYLGGYSSCINCRIYSNGTDVKIDIV